MSEEEQGKVTLQEEKGSAVIILALAMTVF